MKLLLFTLLSLASAVVFAGEGGRGNDWFVKPLPILKFQFPDQSAVIEGVRYQRMMLPKCGPENKKFKYHGEHIGYFPGKNFEAVKVQLFRGQAECSWGVVESDPQKALQILVNNEETNKTETFGGITLHSKSYGGAMAEGNFLVGAVADNKTVVFGVGLNAYVMDFHAVQESYYDRFSWTEAIYIPTGLQKSDRVYFGYSDWGQWRLLLPIAHPAGTVDLVKVASDLGSTSDAQFLDLMNIVQMPGKIWLLDSASTVDQIWSTFERTSDDVDFQNRVYKAYGIPLSAGRQHFYIELYEISRHLDFKFFSTVNVDDINKAAFHKVGTKAEIDLPLVNPTWRVVADLVHELTHALQDSSLPMTDDQVFQNEMEAHTKEQQYLDGLRKKVPALASFIDSYNYIAAAEVPLVKFVNGPVTVKKNSLCSEVVRNYRLDSRKISDSSLRRFGCSRN